MAVPVQRSFVGGEIAPALYARTDSAKYAFGARVIRNFLIRRHGGLELRPGTKFTAESKNSAVQCRLIPFVLDATDASTCYLLELGSGYIRFKQSGARVTTSGVSAWANTTAYKVGDLVTESGVTYYCTTAHTSATGTDRPGVDLGYATKWYRQFGTIYEIPSPYATADLMELQFVQHGSVITLVHPDYAPRELTRTSHTRWALTTVVFGPSIAKPTSVAATGGAAGTIRYWAVTAVKEGSREESLPGIYSSTDKVPSASSTVAVSWDVVAGAESYNVYRSTDGKTYGLIQSAGGTTVVQSDTSWGDANEVATASVGSPVNTWNAAAGQCRNALTISATTKPFNQKFTIKGRFTHAIAASSSASNSSRGRLALYYSRDGETRVLAGYFNLPDTAYAPEFGATNGPHAFSAVVEVPDNGYSSLTIDVVPEVQATSYNVDWESSTPIVEASTVGAASTLTVDFSASPNDVIEWSLASIAFTDDGSDPDFSMAPPASKEVFTVGNFPAAVTNFQQRRLFGNTVIDPEKVWGTRIGVNTSLTISTPLQADDMVEFTTVGPRTNVVKAMMDLGRLVVFGTARIMAFGAEDGSLTPDGIYPRKISAEGIGAIPPLEVGDSAIYVQGRGRHVIDLQPVESGGAFGGYNGHDLSIFAPHLFDGYTIVDWAYARTPHSIVYAVRSDGVLLALTYLREHAIWGWSRLVTDGKIERVCVVPEGDEDAVYLVVNRTIGGVTKRFVERLAAPFVTRVADPEPDETPDPDYTNAFLVDCGVTQNGWHTGTRTMALSGGSSWDNTEQLTLTASASTFVSGDVGDAIHLIGADGSLVIVTIEAYTSATVVTVRADRSVPSGMRSIAIGGDQIDDSLSNYDGEWGFARRTVSGLTHLNGEEVSVLADGFVVASPNNRNAQGNRNYTAVTVGSGIVTLSRPYVVAHVGLPYIGDLVPHEADLIGASRKDQEASVNKAMVFVQGTRGLWAGRPEKPTAANPTNGLDELRPRQAESYDSPPDLRTERVEISFDGHWDKSGRYGPQLLRQVDPLPCTILAVSPVGYGA